MSPAIQNEMAKTASHLILRKILKKVKESEIFSIIVDETSDLNGHEQVSICLRVVNCNLEAEEVFLGLYETSSMTGESIFNLIMDVLKRFNLSLQNLKGQCYDGGRNMAGAIKGVQSRIAKEQPQALYVHCLMHCLNLALQDSAKSVPLARECMQWVHDVGVFIRNSPKRIAMFEDLAKTTLAAKEEKSFKQSASIPKILCPTRFCVRTAALRCLLNSYDVILEMLEECASSSDEAATKARGLYDQLQKGDVYLGILFCYTIFQPCELLSTALQKPSSSVAGALKAADLTLKSLQHLRTEENFNDKWMDMNQAVDKFDLQLPKLPRKKKIPQKLEQVANSSKNHVFINPKDQLRAAYFEILDKVMGEIECRFCQPGIKTYKDLESGILQKPEDWEPSTNVTLKKYGVDVRIFQSQIEILRELIPGTWTSLRDAVQKFKTLYEEEKELLPEVLKVLRLLLVVPATSATAERSFSLLRRLMTYLRSTMSQERLNHLAILNTYKDLVDTLDIKELCQEFINNDYRVTVFGK